MSTTAEQTLALKAQSQGRRTTGLDRLDFLLGGGLVPGETTLLCGPPFTGKGVLWRRAVATGLAEGIPAILLLTDRSTDRVRSELASYDPNFAAHEDEGLVYWVDTVSRSIGADEPFNQAHYIDGATRLEAISDALERARKEVRKAGFEEHRFVVDSASTLLLCNGARTVLPFLQEVLGRAGRANATTLVSLERGLHPEPEVQIVRHLVDGVVDMKTEGTENLLRVEGPRMGNARIWIEYEWGEAHFDITGSISSTRIR